MTYPLVKEFPYQDPLSLFARFAQQPGALLLDSAHVMEGCGRYSYIAIDPFAIMSSKNGIVVFNDAVASGDPLHCLQQKMAEYPLKKHVDLPPFQGGAAGFFSYDLYQHLENMSAKQRDDLEFPDLMIGFYDIVFAFDHSLHKAWIFSSGYPDQNIASRAILRMEWALAQLESVYHDGEPITSVCASVTANFTAETYQAAVQKVRDYILAGDIFEANISQRFSAELSADHTAFALYSKLRKHNPAPFSAYLNFSPVYLASASPERFLKLTDGHVEARPIKGTRKRDKIIKKDQELAAELQNSAKDRAENIMIVDLMRNDLSKVCEAYTVEVPQLCGVESYATVHHLVSVVTGKLKQGIGAIDLLRATFPGGSITGAPKIRAMEIIAEIEPTQRGPYCGALGFLAFNGDMDLSILIRTFAIKHSQVVFQAGGAVVADSDPYQEYAETLLKASALQRALSE